MKKLVLLALCAVVVSVSAKDWWETASFYQIYPQTFLDSGVGKDGTGDFAGIEKKLDYLKNLGIDALWLTPIFESSYAAFGYDITNYEEVDTRYGSRDDFKKLVTAVHAKGMKIIVDFVPNHCGINNEFFQKFLAEEDPYKNWFIKSDRIGNPVLGKPSNWQAIGGPPGSAWNKIDGKEEFYYAQFNGNMPDLNFREEAVRTYFEKVMTTWLDFGLDGFRIDAISHGYEAEKNGSDYYPDEPKNDDYKGTDESNFDFLQHIHTQDQPELFELVYNWRAFLDKYQADKKTEAK